MPDEYIPREAAVKAAQDGADEWDGGYNRNRDAYIECAIDNVPAADVVEVRHGHWKPWKYKGMGLLPISGYQCSRCGVVMDGIEDTPTAYHLHYCPNCGAKMDGDGE